MRLSFRPVQRECPNHFRIQHRFGELDSGKSGTYGASSATNRFLGFAPSQLISRFRKVGRAVSAAATANQRVLVHHDGAHGVTRLPNLGFIRVHLWLDSRVKLFTPARSSTPRCSSRCWSGTASPPRRRSWTPRAGRRRPERPPGLRAAADYDRATSSSTPNVRMSF